MNATKPTCKMGDGNIFVMISAARRALRRAGLHEQAFEMSAKAMEAKSYDDAVQIIMGYVDVE